MHLAWLLCKSFLLQIVLQTSTNDPREMIFFFVFHINRNSLVLVLFISIILIPSGFFFFFPSVVGLVYGSAFSYFSGVWQCKQIFGPSWITLQVYVCMADFDTSYHPLRISTWELKNNQSYPNVFCNLPIIWPSLLVCQPLLCLFDQYFFH